jgi:methyl-accepting chemotaxis protein
MKFKVGRSLSGKISLFTNIPFILVIVLMGLITMIKLDHDLSRQARINRQNIVNLSLEMVPLLDREQIKPLIESIRVGEKGYIMLIDGEGEVIAGTISFLKWADTDNDNEARSRLAAFSAEVLSAEQNAEKDEIFYSTRSGEVAATYTYISELGWHLVVHDFTDEYMKVISSFRMIIVFTILFAGILVGMLVRSLMNRVLSPIRSIKKVSDQVALGDLSGRIEISSGDEIGELGRFFNTVVESFALLVENIQDASAVLLESTHSLGASTQEVSSTANQQAASVKEILSTMEDSDKLSQGVAVRIQEVAKVANHTRETVEKGFSLIQGSLGKMGEIKETNSHTIGGIKILGNQIDSIWEIVNIINGIADQTKIIAFNAELEAAAAGEAGKNFQIVAGEIRRLADSTVDSTNEIKSKINEIQHASDKLILASEEGTQRIREGWEISDNIKGVFEDVLSSSEISAGSANDIAQAIKMQVASFEQIFLTLKQISEGIDNFAVSTRATSEASDSLKEIADQFSESVSRYSLGGEEGDE